MNCRDIQTQLAESTSFSKLTPAVQQHVEHCVECQGFYPTKPLLKDLLEEAWPEIEPDARLLASVRQSLDREMERPAAGAFGRSGSPSIGFAAGVAALFAVLALPLAWMGGQTQGIGQGIDPGRPASRARPGADRPGRTVQ
jgi:hypothetical protein